MDVTSGRTDDSEFGWAIYTRDARRYRVPVGVGAWVELGLSADENERCRFRLLDLSWGGVSFELPLEVGRLATGDRVPDAVIGVGRTTIEGSLEVLYVANDEHGMPRCGGRFVPAGPTDETALGKLLVRLDHLTTHGLWVPS